jgi:orotidine 5'-phosphate decarboxylase subfamily 2
MASHPVIAKQLEETGGFKDVPITLLTSGIPGIYYVNTEALVRDGGEFKNYENDPGAMYKHVVAMMNKHKPFREVVDILAEKVDALLKDVSNGAISGGQTRDWLFSMPVAHVLDLPHLSIRKPEKGGSIEAHIKDGIKCEEFPYELAHAVHIADLITQGSSFYEIADNKPQGWIPLLRKAGVTISDAVIVTTRLQGGEELLRSRDVTPHTLVSIDEEYLKAHSKNQQSVLYFQDPLRWSRNYLAEHGAKAFARFFDPSAGKLDRAKAFLQQFGDELVIWNRMNELAEITQMHYKLSPRQIVSGETRYSAGNTFADKWHAAVARKDSILCAGLDPADYWQAAENTLPEKVDKLAWCLDFIDKVAPYAAAVKPNRNFIKDFSQSEVRSIVDRIHSHGMVAIDDSKLADIGNTNDSGFYHADQEGYDAVTYAPFPGNIGEAAKQAHNRGLGLIPLVLMSNPEYKLMKNAQLGDKRLYEHVASEIATHNIDGMVIGAPSPSNHITDSEVRRVRELAGERLVLMPGIGAQGGDAKYILDVFGDNVIANVGRAVLYAKDPAAEAKKYRDMLNGLRKK